MDITCIIPIKYESTRVPGKNFRLFNGKPLLYWVISTLISIDKINRIVIDTDSDKIEEIVNNLFHDERIVIYQRPEHLHGGHISTNLLINNVIQGLGLESDIYLQTHVTNPLVKKKTFEGAINEFINKQDEYESLFSVKKHLTRFYYKNGDDMNHNRFKLIPTQELEPIYEENSCIYVFTQKTLDTYNARIGSHALLYEMTDIESQDIDWEEDFIIAELLHNKYNL